MIQSLGLVLNISHFRRGETWSKDGTPELPQKETVDTTHMMDIVGTSFVLSGQGHRAKYTPWPCPDKTNDVLTDMFSLGT